MRSDNAPVEWRLGDAGRSGFFSRVIALGAGAAGIFWAFYELVRLALVMRMRFGGAYWRWRMETAFGRGLPRSRWELMRSLVEYGRWVHEVRCGR